jgi:hypothetical protein
MSAIRRLCSWLNCQIKAAPLDRISDFIKGDEAGDRGPGASSSTGAERLDEPIDEHADAWGKLPFRWIEH